MKTGLGATQPIQKSRNSSFLLKCQPLRGKKIIIENDCSEQNKAKSGEASPQKSKFETF